MTVRSRVFLATVLTLALPPAALAQQWLVNSAINNQIIETAICDGAVKKGQRLPDVCGKYAKYASTMAAQGGAATGATAGANRPAAPAAPVALPSTRFSPVGDDAALQQVTDSLGSNAQERQQLGQIARAGKQVFEQKYGAKGWGNTVAGAYAFFIISTATVHTGAEPDAAAQDRLYDVLNHTLAQQPEMAKASAQEKTALYNTLLVGGGLPLIFYLDGKQQNNAATVAKARELAAGMSRRLMSSEPQALAAMVQAR